MLQIEMNKPAFDNSWCSHRGHSSVIACVHGSLSYVKVEIPYKVRKLKKKGKRIHNKESHNLSEFMS